jgi:hypothetical protein
MVSDEAEAALAYLRAHRDGATSEVEAWSRVAMSEGYRLLQPREESMGRPFRDEDVRAYLQRRSSSLASLEMALREWSSIDMRGPAERAFRYLPTGAKLVARVFPVIKPAQNSFVFQTGTDSAAIFLALDPARTRAWLDNTIAHELHHIGLAASCPSTTTATDPRLALVHRWAGAFGEGVAMLAAAGGTNVHPHASSDAADRARWDRDMRNAAADIEAVERFFSEVLGGRIAGDSVTRRGMEFLGVQGPWYTVGYLMASTIERVRGRDALTAVVCDGVALMRTYNAAADAGAPRWSKALLRRLR